MTHLGLHDLAEQPRYLNLNDRLGSAEGNKTIPLLAGATQGKINLGQACWTEGVGNWGISVVTWVRSAPQ